MYAIKGSLLSPENMIFVLINMNVWIRDPNLYLIFPSQLM